MGQAKNRGTYEERQQAAFAHVEKTTAAWTEHLEKLDAAEKASKEYMDRVAKASITMFLDHQERERKSRMGIRIGGGDGHAS